MQDYFDFFFDALFDLVFLELLCQLFEEFAVRVAIAYFHVYSAFDFAFWSFVLSSGHLKRFYFFKVSLTASLRRIPEGLENLTSEGYNSNKSSKHLMRSCSEQEF